MSGLSVLRRSAAVALNGIGSRFVDKGKRSAGRNLCALAAKIDPHWSVPWFNLGLDFKNSGAWEDSLRCNQTSTQLGTNDEAAWWNLGIAATALHNWSEARRAWKA